MRLRTSLIIPTNSCGLCRDQKLKQAGKADYLRGHLRSPEIPGAVGPGQVSLHCASLRGGAGSTTPVLSPGGR